MNQLITKENTATLDSREVAEMLGKEHYELLKDIEGRKDGKGVGIIPTLLKGNFHVSDYFNVSSYKDDSGKSNKCYNITKKGCEILGNKQQGEKGILFTAKYVEKFNHMEQQLKAPKCIEDVIILQLEEQKKIKSRVEKLENNMTIDYAQQENLSTRAKAKIVQALGGKEAPAYSKLSKKAFSLFWRDYKRFMQVASYKDTPIKEIDRAFSFINKWEPTEELHFMILGVNSQMRIIEKGRVI
jgi:Rha family phage regulatory protein